MEDKPNQVRAKCAKRDYSVCECDSANDTIAVRVCACVYVYMYAYVYSEQRLCSPKLSSVGVCLLQIHERQTARASLFLYTFPSLASPQYRAKLGDKQE